MSFSQRIFRSAGAQWFESGVLVAPTAAPTLATDGVPIPGGASHLQYRVTDMTAVTDYSLRVWAYIDPVGVEPGWSLLAEHLTLGPLSRVFEAAATTLSASRYYVQLSSLTGTSLRVQHRSA